MGVSPMHQNHLDGVLVMGLSRFGADFPVHTIEPRRRNYTPSSGAQDCLGQSLSGQPLQIRSAGPNQHLELALQWLNQTSVLISGTLGGWATAQNFGNYLQQWY